jgi:uncharacterized protein
MSQENVQTVRDSFAAPDLDGAASWWHPEIEWIVAREHPEARTLVGRGAIATYLQDWEATLDGLQIDVDELLDAGDTVVAVGNVRGGGTDSGADVSVPIAFLCTVRDGKLVRVEEYLDTAEALNAVGLAK